MERPVVVVSDSAGERRLLWPLVAVGVAVLGSSVVLPLEPFLGYLAAAFVAVALGFTYAALATTHRNGLQAVRQAELTRAATAAPVVTVRIVPDLTVSGSSDEIRIDVDLEVENHGTTPAVVAFSRPATSQPSTGSLPVGPVPLAPRGTQSTPALRRVPLTVRIPRALVGSSTRKHGLGWPVVVALNVRNTIDTVTDEYRLSFDLRPHQAGDGCAWTLEKDPGYGSLVRRVCADAGSGPAHPPTLEHRIVPARALIT